MSAPADNCEPCGHNWGQHDLVATTGNPMDGGIILCPEPGCECYSTWSTEGKGKETVYEPPFDEVDLLRAELQGFFEAHDLDLDVPDIEA